jgi:hypothetical protein
MTGSILHRIQEKVKAGQYEVTIHAFEEAQQDGLSVFDMLEVVKRGGLYKQYTADPRGARYEIHGRSEDGRSVGLVCRFNSNGEVRIITVFALKG